MKAALVGVTVARFVEGVDGSYNRSSRALRTWREATATIAEWLRDAATRGNGPNTILVRPRWQNGLVLYEIGFDRHDAAQIADLGAVLRSIVNETYGPGKRRLTSVKASMAREVLARCAFNDHEAGDMSEDARVLDAATRSLEQCFPDHAALYVERIKSWMLSGGGVR